MYSMLGGGVGSLTILKRVVWLVKSLRALNIYHVVGSGLKELLLVRIAHQRWRICRCWRIGRPRAFVPELEGRGANIDLLVQARNKSRLFSTTLRQAIFKALSSSVHIH
jgi:hypothetical protein